METHYRCTNQAQALMRALVIGRHPEMLNVINQTLAVGCLVGCRAKGKENALIIICTTGKLISSWFLIAAAMHTEMFL